MYELGARLGRGYRAEVFRAVDRRDGSAWALKLFAADEAGRTAARFEAEALRALAHPRLPAFHDALEVDGRPAVAMAVVAGPDLRTEVERGGGLPVPSALRMGTELCDLLVHVGARGWTLRDLHPRNVHRLTPGGTMALDLDGARPEGWPAEGGGRVMYRAPELLQGPVTPACDVYSLAGCLYFALAADDPPRASGPLEWPGLASALAAALNRCRSQIPPERPAAEAVAEALRRFV